MNSPNLQQRIYLAKALNENTDALFDHPEMNEASRGVPFSTTQAELRKRNLIAGKAWLAKKSKTHTKVPANNKKGYVWVPKQEGEMNEAVTRKHFQQVADIIKAHPDAKKRAELAAHHAEIFKKQNPRFDHERFFKAANAEKPMNEEEMGEESISEGVRRMRRLRRAHVSGKGSRKTADAYDKELSKLSASRLRRGGAGKQTVRAFFTDKPVTPAADNAYGRFTKDAMDKAHAKGKKIFEDMDLDEGSYVHSKGQLNKAIKGSKREIVKAIKNGDKKEAEFWMQNKKDAENQLKEATQLYELSLVKKALVKARKSMRGTGVVGHAALAASNVAPNLWGGVHDADKEHRRKINARIGLERKGKIFGKVQEATRSKYLKVYGKHKVGSDESKMNLASLKRDIAVLRRGGADAETLRGAAESRGRYVRNEKPDPSYNPHDAAMAGYRFANMASRSKEAGKKSPRKVNEATLSKVGKAYRKFGHGSEYNLADLKRKVATLRRGGASDEILKSYPAIYAQGGYHNKAEITTARGNFMARGMGKQNASPSFREKFYR